MKRIFLPSLVLSATVMLSACNKTPDYKNLMTHPDLLKKEYTRCQNTTTDTTYCQLVNKAANDFATYENERQASPEGFGMQVMLEEAHWVNAKQALIAAKQAGDQTKIDDAKKAYHDQAEKVHILWAVIAATSGAD